MKKSFPVSGICFISTVFLIFNLMIINQSLAFVKEAAIFKTSKAYPENLRQLHQNVLKSILNSPSRSDGFLKYAQELKPDGSWADIDYANKERGGWLPVAHLSRISAMAKAYHTLNSGVYQQKEFSEKIHRALNFWFANDFICPNWWYPQIGVPQILNPVMILMETELTPDQKARGIKILDRSKIGMTGQNKVWQSGNVLLKSLLLRDAETIKKAAEAIQSELVVSLQEGIQPDWSYHQHGPQLQWGNYGLAYIDDMSYWISVLRGTPFKFDERKVTVLRNYLLEGQQWITWKNLYDISGCGRQVFPRAQQSKAASLARYYQRMETVDPEFAADYRKANQWQTLSGNRYFWRADIMIQRTPDYYFSVKMSSERTIGAETVNSENIRGFYMGDGAIFLYQSTKEYDNIFPYWDWRKIPGVTSHLEKDTLNNLSASRNGNHSSFTGGVSDGQNGIAVMRYNRRGLVADKAWFMFNNMMVCLGTDITSSAGIPVATSVSQSFLNGDVILKTNSGERIAGKTEDISNPVWLLHDHIGYFFPDGGKLKLEAKSTEGSWKRTTLRYPDEKLTADIFSLWFDHGMNPDGQSYAYVLVPDADKTVLEKMEKQFSFLIKNLKSRQEVISSDGSFAGIVFYEAGRSEIFGGIEVSQPCLLMLKKTNNEIQLSVADPTQKLKEIQVKISGSAKPDRNIILPQGGDAGKTATFSL